MEVLVPTPVLGPVEAVSPAPVPALKEGLQKPISEAPLYSFQATHITEALKLKEIAKLFDLKPTVLKPDLLSYDLGSNSACFLYNFGSVVFFNVAPEVQQSTLNRLRDFLSLTETPVTSEEFFLQTGSKQTQVFFDRVVTTKLKSDKVELLAHILAQSTALEYFELKVADILERTGSILEGLGRKGRMKLSEKETRKLIGFCMMTKQNLISSLALLEKPDETWESESLDRLYQEAEGMFELKDRFRTLEYKLKTIQDNISIIADLLSTKLQVRLETIIVVLILIEIALFVYELIAG